MIQLFLPTLMMLNISTCNSCIYREHKGEVFEVDPSSGGIIKNNLIIHNGNNNLFRNHSMIEIVDSKLYRYGGYGYNQTNNKVSYFDSKISKWSYLKLNSFDDHNGIFDGFSFSLDKEIYFFGGKKINELNGMEEVTNYDVISLNLQTSSLKKIGTTKLDFSKLIYFSRTPKGILFRDKLFITEIDLSSNRIRKYNLPVELKNYNKKDKSLFFENNIVKSLKSNSTFKLSLTNPISDEKFLIKPFSWEPLFSLPIFLIILIYIYYYKRKNIILINPNSIRYKNKMMLLNFDELNVLNNLIIKREMSGTEIINLIDNNKITYSQLTRTRRTIIENLNHVLRYLLDKKTDSIIVTKSKIDKRNKIYKLDLDTNIRHKIVD